MTAYGYDPLAPLRRTAEEVTRAKQEVSLARYRRDVAAVDALLQGASPREVLDVTRLHETHLSRACWEQGQDPTYFDLPP